MELENYSKGRDMKNKKQDEKVDISAIIVGAFLLPLAIFIYVTLTIIIPLFYLTGGEIKAAPVTLTVMYVIFSLGTLTKIFFMK